MRLRSARGWEGLSLMPKADYLPDKGAQPRVSHFVRAGAQGSLRVFP